MKRVEVVESNAQPLPSPEEWDEALAILRKDPELGPLLEKSEVSPYPAMPPLSTRADATGRVERALHVGLLAKPGAARRNQIVGVNLIRELVTRYEDGHPPLALATDEVCGAPRSAPCMRLNRGTSGTLWLSWPQDAPLWSFLVTRPSASTGTRGSGIEIEYAFYKGKQVLSRAHTPILNVLYDEDRCGPYRDWIYSEYCFQADGVDLAPGFRWCPADRPPTTIYDTG